VVILIHIADYVRRVGCGRWVAKRVKYGMLRCTGAQMNERAEMHIACIVCGEA
jgi:hypothetical protein